MAKKTYTKEERRAQFLKTGIALAKKGGLNSVTAVAVAAKHEVTAPLVFHIFGSRSRLREAIKQEAEKQGITLPEAKVEKKAPRKKAEKKAPRKKSTKKYPTQPVPAINMADGEPKTSA